MAITRIIFFFFAFIGFAQSQRYVRELGVQMGDNGCNKCWMKVNIHNDHDDQSSKCKTGILDSSENNWQANDYNEFDGDEIGECNGYDIDIYGISSLDIHHQGAGGVTIDYWDVVLSDGSSTRCYDNHFYDSDERRSIYC